MYYFENFLRGNYVAIQFRWINLFPDCGFTQPPESIKDGNMTSILKVKEQRPSSNFKLACRPSLTTGIRIHKPRYFLNGQGEVYYADSKEAYVAHVRLGQYSTLPTIPNCKWNKVRT